VNRVGQGRAIYVASRNDERFLSDLYGALSGQLGLLRALPVELPEGVSAALRTDGDRRFVFLMNFAPKPVTVDLAEGPFTDLLTGESVGDLVDLGPYGVLVLTHA